MQILSFFNLNGEKASINSSLFYIFLFSLYLLLISPSFSLILTTCSNISYSGNYSLGQNISISLNSSQACFSIEAPNVYFDCNGNSVTSTSPYSGFAFSLLNVSNVTLKNCRASLFNASLILINSSSNYLSANSLINNTYGLYFSSSPFNQVNDTNSSLNSIGIFLDSSSPSNLIFNNFFSNTINVQANSASFWNTSKVISKNILGGAFIGGNFYSNYSGFDGDGDGIGESPYLFNNGVDFLPLTTNLSLNNCFYAGYDNFVYNINFSMNLNKSDGACITVLGENVSIYCNGFDLVGNALESEQLKGILVLSNNFSLFDCSVINYSYGLFAENVSSLRVENSSFFNSSFGIYLYNVSNSLLENNSLIGFYQDYVGDQDYSIFSFASSFESSNVINSSFIGIYANSSSISSKDIFYNCSSSCFILVNSTANLSSFSYSSTTYANFSSSNITLRDFAVGFSNEFGIINWSYVGLSQLLLQEGKNIRLERDFVSLNSSDPLASPLNKSANVTLFIEYCTYDIYKKVGFPLYKLDVLENGSVYEDVPSCAFNKARFEADSFSGFAAGVSLNSWWNCSFAYRIVYEINNSFANVSGAILSIYINHSIYPSYLFKENGEDIRVVDKNLQEVPFYISYFNVNSTTLIYAKINTTFNSTEYLYVYFGNEEASSKSNLSAVFDSVLEVGRIILPAQTYAGQWVLNVSFNNTIQNPVLVLGPDVTYSGVQEFYPRVRNLTPYGFEIRQQEPSNRDDIHISETLYYFAMPQGVYLTEDGKLIEGRTQILSIAKNGRGQPPTTSLIYFTLPLNNPIVVSSVVDFSSTNYVHTRQRNIQSTSFELYLEPEENQNAGSVSPSLVSWIALENSSGSWDGKLYETSLLTTNQNFGVLSFLNNYSYPAVVASMQTLNGGDSAVLRGRNLQSNSVELRVQEDTTRDAETNHVNEVIGVFVFEEGVYPLRPYTPNISINESFANITKRVNLTYPNTGLKVDKGEEFTVSCEIKANECFGCSTSGFTYLQFFNGSDWITANSTTLLSTPLNGISTTLSCPSSQTVNFTAKINELNQTLRIRCLTTSSSNASYRSNQVVVIAPYYEIEITNPENYEIVYKGSSVPINVKELFGKDDIIYVNISIDGVNYTAIEIFPDVWEYVWNIPPTQPEGFVKIIAYAFNSTSLVATKEIEVYVREQVVCEWVNTTFKYKIAALIRNTENYDIGEVMVPLTLKDLNFSLFQPNGEDLYIVDLNNNEIPFWIEQWNFNNQSIVWVRLNFTGGETKIINIYFGNESGVVPLSNRTNTFFRPFGKPYYVAFHASLSGALNLTSYVDNNYLVSSSLNQIVNEKQVVATSFNKGELINSTYPIASTITQNAGDSVIPIAFAGTTFVYPFGARTGSTDSFSFYAVFNDSFVEVFSDGTLVNSVNVPQGSWVTITADIANNQNAIIKASSPIIAYHDGGNRDSVIMVPASTELYGISSSAFVSALQDNTLVTIYDSSGAVYSTILSSNGFFNIGGGGSQGTGVAVRLVADKPIGAIQRADGDGVEESTFLPLSELDNYYVLPTTAEYVAIACPYPTAIDIYSPSGVLITTLNCNALPPNPGKAYYSATNLVAGTSLNSSLPFYLYYESIHPGENSGGETNILSFKQFRGYTSPLAVYVGKVENRTSDLEVLPFILPTEKKEFEDINFSSIIVNNRVATPSPFNVSFIVEFNSINYTIDKVEVPSLACGANVSLNFSLNHSNLAGGVGIKKLIVFADEDNVVNEVDENNNIYSRDVSYSKALLTTCRNALAVNRNITKGAILTLRAIDDSIYPIYNVSLSYSPSSPPLPSSCVLFSPSFFSSIPALGYYNYSFIVNVSCAPIGTSLGLIKLDGLDYYQDHNLSQEVCQISLTKDSNGVVVGSSLIDFSVVEPFSYNQINFTIQNNDEGNITNLSFTFSNMLANPSSNIIPSSSLSYISVLPIENGSSKDQLISINLSNTMPGLYLGNANSSFYFNDNYSLVIEANFTTRVRVPFIYDLDGDGSNEWVFDDNNNYNPDADSFVDYGDPTPSVLIYNSTTLTSSSKRGFLIDTNGDNLPDKFWDPTFYGNQSGLVTNVNQTDSNNDGVLDFLIDNDGDGIYERVFDGKRDYELPDLVMEAINVYPKFSSKRINITINVTVNNSGGFNASNFEVGLYVNGNYISNQSVAFLGAGDKINLTFLYENSFRGNSTVLVRADILNVIYESNDTRQGWNLSNNQISDWFYSNLSHWAYIYGKINTSLILSDSTNVFYKWIWNGTGNVYVVPQNSFPSLSSLVALGRTPSLTPSLSDFDEFDSLVGLSGYSDSSRNLYTIGDGSTPKETLNITFFDYTIYYSPIYNSSDYYTEFVTAIAWDSSDDTNGEFDISDNEDVVLISPIKLNSTGSFGVYDYEIRVPEFFDTYKGGSYVEIWMEIR